MQANMAEILQFFDGTALVTCLALFIGILWLIYWLGLYRYNLFLGGSPLPGPKPWPWVGNLPDVFKYGGIHKMLLQYFYKYGRVYKICIGRSPAIVVCDPEIVKQIMVKEFWKFPNRPPFLKPNPPFDSGLFVAENEKWKRIRTTLTPTFTASKLKQIVPLIEQASDALMSKMEKFAKTGESVDAVNLFSLFALDVIMKAAFGMETNIQINPDPVLVEKAKEVFQTPLWLRFFSMFPFWSFFSRYVNILQNADFFVNLSRGILQKRRQQGVSGQRDLVQLMLEAHREETVQGVSKLSDDEVTAQSVTFLVAGFETTGSTLSTTAYLLATHPEVQKRIIREVDEVLKTRGEKSLYEVIQGLQYLDQVVSEVLRLYGPAFSIARSCAEEAVYKGIRFPKGIEVNIPSYVLHRDPEIWDNPLEFNPENFSPEAKEKRDAYSFLPFGVGPRQCMGMRLAMVEIKLGLLEILRRFTFERAPETVATLEHTAVLLLRPKDTIYVKIKAR